MQKGDKYIQKYYNKDPVTIVWVSSKEVCFESYEYNKNFVMRKYIFNRLFEKIGEKSDSIQGR